jgi:tol-pal system protein YbgF
MRIHPLFVTATLLLSAGSVFGASKEQLEMQRDIAQMQDQLRTLQSTVDQKMSALQVLVQQALDAASKANTSMNVLNAGVTSTLERELKQALTPVAGLAAKVDNTNNDVSEVRNQVQDLNNAMNRITQTLTDLNNAIKVMQPPAAPAPAPGAGGGGGSGPPPPAEALFTAALRDENGGKYDLAVSEFQDFIRYYPDNPNAARAQYNIGECHYTAQKYEQAAADFQIVIDKYPDSTDLVPQAYFLKGMSLKNTNKTEAAKAWRAVIAKYPKSDSAAQAKEQLRALGLTVAGPSSPATAAKHRTMH